MLSSAPVCYDRVLFFSCISFVCLEHRLDHINPENCVLWYVRKSLSQQNPGLVLPMHSNFLFLSDAYVGNYRWTSRWCTPCVWCKKARVWGCCFSVWDKPCHRSGFLSLECTMDSPRFTLFTSQSFCCDETRSLMEGNVENCEFLCKCKVLFLCFRVWNCHYKYPELEKKPH